MSRRIDIVNKHKWSHHNSRPFLRIFDFKTNIYLFIYLFSTSKRQTIENKRTKTRARIFISSERRKNISITACYNAESNLLPSVLIFKDMRKEEFADGLPAGLKFSRTLNLPNTNSELFYRWLK